jgi:hypothetical protein
VKADRFLYLEKNESEGLNGKQKIEFDVEIYRPGPLGSRTSWDLELPATQSELRDTLEKARVLDERTEYEFELLYCNREYLAPRIDTNGNLFELNELAKQLQRLGDTQSAAFEAMVEIESGRKESLSVRRLLNLANSTDNCYLAGDVHNDEQLGRFLYVNEFLTEETDRNIERKFYDPSADKFWARLGKEHRETEGGIFTEIGYVEFNGDVNVFQIADSPDTIIRFNDEVCVDCIIPQAVEWINEADDRETVDRFIAAVTEFHKNGELTLYKALLEAEKCADLEKAARLSDKIEWYQLDSERSYYPSEYANMKLKEILSHHYGIDFPEFRDIDELGKFLMEFDVVQNTSYGELRLEYDARELLLETFEEVEIFGEPALFSDSRIEHSMLPEGLYVYDIRGGDEVEFCTIETKVTVDHAGTLITAEPLDFGGKDYIQINDGLNFLGYTATLKQYIRRLKGVT